MNAPVDPGLADAALPRRERVVVAAGLAIVCALAWAITTRWALGMRPPITATADVPGMPMTSAWGAADAALVLAMWVVMMVAMMVPSAAPMIATFARVNHRRRARGGDYVPTAVFLVGYLVAWTAFSAVATLLQWGLTASGLLTPMMASHSRALSAALFVAAGLYQWSPLKEACLGRCRSPIGFVLMEWRDGRRGALVMGLRHGAFCVGCCAGLMLLLFAVAVMDLRWVGALTALVTAEKLLPWPRLWRHAIGAGLVLAGVAAGAGLAW